MDKWSSTLDSGANCTVVPVTPPVVLGEGPHWDSETQVLFYVDIISNRLNKYDPATSSVTSAQFGGGGLSLVVPVEGTHAQQLLITLGRDILLVFWDQQNVTFDNSTNGNKIEVIASVDPDKPENRWNDGKADAKGRLWGGTMGPQRVIGHVIPDMGTFYLLPSDTSFPISKVSPVSIPNGLAWNKENTLLYFTDTATKQIDVFDFDLEAGIISNRRKVFNLPENGVEGNPDGMTIDSNGNLWLACYNGSQVINVNPLTGELVQSVRIPALNVTSVAFGGPNLDIMYVTTSRWGLSDEELKKQPHAGSVFAVTGLGVSALSPANNIIISK